jgi:hypothetical protein
MKVFEEIGHPTVLVSTILAVIQLYCVNTSLGRVGLPGLDGKSAFIRQNNQGRREQRPRSLHFRFAWRGMRIE